MGHLIELRREGRSCGRVLNATIQSSTKLRPHPAHLMLHLGALEVVHVAVAVEEVAL